MNSSDIIFWQNEKKNCKLKNIPTILEYEKEKLYSYTLIHSISQYILVPFLTCSCLTLKKEEDHWKFSATNIQKASFTAEISNQPMKIII